jgi:septal ring factor EnvC (AmiA/AmiB activator)
MKLSSNAKIADIKTLEDEMMASGIRPKPFQDYIDDVEEQISNLPDGSDSQAALLRKKAQAADMISRDVSALAIQKGFDAVRVPGFGMGEDGGFMVILNRTALIMEDVKP